jgi:hypothetical protein
VKGRHDQCWFGLTCGLKMLLLQRLEHGVELYMGVGTQLLLLLLNLYASSFRCPFTREKVLVT